MDRIRVRSVLGALLICTAALAGAQTVRTGAGTLQGASADGIESFKGIPYAAPPVGDRRWRPPQAVKAWSGVRPARAFGADCMQKPLPGDAAVSTVPFDEDCLYLNIWRPAGTAAGAGRPVLVWIHGGGFLNGGSSPAVYDGSALAREGLVVVSFNYRLGRLGFFAHPALAAEPYRPLANYALLDQRAALQWVRRHIAAFGGDPQSVTVAGESAGGISVLQLLQWPATHRLFHRAVVMSGGGRGPLLGGLPLRGEASAETAGVALARNAGIAGDDAASLRALRALPAAQVNGDLNMAALLTRPADYAGGPVVDGQVVRADATLAGSRVARVPLLIGSTSADLAAALPRPPEVFAWFGPEAPAAAQAYASALAGPPPQLLMEIGADFSMHEPARFAARTFAARGQPAWLYRFGYVAQALRPQVSGAPHASELPYLFGTLPAVYGERTADADRATSRALLGYVANFAKRGDPNGPELPPWPRASATTTELMQFTPDEGPRMTTDPRTAQLDLVERAQSRRSAGAAR